MAGRMCYSAMFSDPPLPVSIRFILDIVSQRCIIELTRSTMHSRSVQRKRSLILVQFTATGGERGIFADHRVALELLAQ